MEKKNSREERIATSVISIIFIAFIASLFFRESWCFYISAYQKCISPYKRYHCAYAKYHNDISCSEYGKRAIAEKGILSGLRALDRRFDECQIASEKINKKPKSNCCCQDGNRCTCPGCCSRTCYGESWRDTLNAKDSLFALNDSLRRIEDKKRMAQCKKSCKECGDAPRDMMDCFSGCCDGGGGGGAEDFFRGIIPPGTN